MCGRFEQNKTNPKIKAIHDQARGILQEQYPLPLKLAVDEIFPTDLVAVILLDQDGPEVAPMIWGFPKWNGKGVIINTVSETALSKPIWRDSLFYRPIAVPSTGFFEWREEPDCANKRKYIFRNHPSDLLYLAGLYQGFDAPEGSVRERFTILTRPANFFMNDFHHRMPLLLTEHELEDWLSGEKLDYFLKRDPLELMAVRADQPPLA